jgi:hypothetical protein
MRLSRFLLATLPVVAVWAATARGQTGDGQAEERFLQQQRLADEQLRQKRQELAPVQSWLDLEWGGWIEYYLFHFDDGLQSSRFVQRPGLSFWTRLRVDDGAHEVFARVKLRYTHFRPGDEFERQEDWWGPNFDQAWYQIDFGRALRLTRPADPVQLKARIGRQQVVFGTGYALDMPQDAVLLDAKLYDLRVLGLVGKSVPSFPNIDRSEPVDSHSDRLFYGVQLSYEGWQRHRPFVYALRNNDRTDERPRDWSQNYSYDSFYLGFGAQGELAHNLNYWLEGVLESGHSFGDRQFLERDYVEAFGWDVGLEKLFDVPMRPRMVAEYMFASGDGDRLFSPTNAAGGNRGSREDTSFVGFGFRDTGISLAPTTSNLHVWRLGASLAPLERCELLRDLEVGTNWFLYHKNRQRAAISDPLADNFEGYVGWEMDYFINWRLASDLSWTIRWGSFFPGSAYSDQDTRHFLFTGLTWSF